MHFGLNKQPTTVLHTKIYSQPEAEFTIANKVKNTWYWGKNAFRISNWKCNCFFSGEYSLKEFLWVGQEILVQHH